MFFYLRNKNKTIKELRKNRSYTAKQLAERLRMNQNLILRVDDTKLKNVPEPLKSKLLPALKDDNLDNYPW
ncbi:transcriptional regulator [Sporosalibacterium faouarense]|uniref:transcriptional regulator n=1 Tax=Sporosalibacterium faouarense TaxID=516123 RepID=UPI00141C5A43|nr:transcriptional regulator [Sporosalibacterium faouarense]MTI49568.1 transcriptional regulator [Bacillota bacterium]